MRILMVMVALAIAGPAVAQKAACPAGASPDIVKLVDWSATAQKMSYGSATSVMVNYANASGRPIRMIDALVIFADALGGHMGSAAIARDVNLGPGANRQETNRYPGAFERLPTLRKEDVIAIVCTKAVLFDNGEKREFK